MTDTALFTPTDLPIPSGVTGFPQTHDSPSPPKRSPTSEQTKHEAQAVKGEIPATPVLEPAVVAVTPNEDPHSHAAKTSDFGVARTSSDSAIRQFRHALALDEVSVIFQVYRRVRVLTSLPS